MTQPDSASASVLEDLITGTDAPWPPARHAVRLRNAATYGALFENDRAAMRRWVRRLGTGKGRKEIVPYPMTQIAARTLASFLFGENATFTASAGQKQVDEWIDTAGVHALNQEASVTAFVEGEGFYKLDEDPDVSDEPILSFIGSSNTIPLFRFGRLIEVAFFTEFADENKRDVHRWIEFRDATTIRHRLFKGSTKTLGQELDLDQHPETAHLAATITNPFQPLGVAHVPCYRWSKDPHGISIFSGKDGLIEAVHALYSQDQHDAEMAKFRIAISEEFLERDEQQKPVFDRTSDLMVMSKNASGNVGDSVKPVHPIQFTDSGVMAERIGQRIDEFLLACGIAPQSAGRDIAGAAESGTARKLAQALTLMTVATAARYFTIGLSDIVTLALKRDEPVIVVINDGTPDDPAENAERLGKLRAANLISIRTGIRELHPDWDEKAIDEEEQRILDEQGLALGDPLSGDLNDPNDADPEDTNPNPGSEGANP